MWGNERNLNILIATKIPKKNKNRTCILVKQGSKEEDRLEDQEGEKERE